MADAWNCCSKRKLTYIDQTAMAGGAVSVTKDEKGNIFVRPRTKGECSQQL
jgi:hypothetical protein